MILISDKYRDRSELMAARIVRKNIRKIIADIPFGNMTKSTYNALILANITEEKIGKMYNELYFTIGEPIYNSIEKKLKAVKFFNENLFNELMNAWLQANAGLNITSVRATLIQNVIDTIAQGYEKNISISDIVNLLTKQGFYRAQSLRIARTETTTITNASTFMAGSSSDLVMDKVWISARDDRTRRRPRDKFDHLHMNGVKVPYDDKFVVNEEPLLYPGQQSNKKDIITSGANVINCRCKIALIPRVDESGFPIRKTSNKPIIPINKPIEENNVIINAIGTDGLKFDANLFALNKAKEFGVKGKINVVYNEKSKNLGGATGWNKDENGVYGSNNKIDIYGKLTDKQIQGVISHEMRHIMQMQTKQFEFKGGFYYWNGEKHVSSDTYKKYTRLMNSAQTREKRQYYYKKYVETPWELDAHRSGDVFGALEKLGIKSENEGMPTDIIEPAEWDKPIPFEQMTFLDLEMLKKN